MGDGRRRCSTEDLPNYDFSRSVATPRPGSVGIADNQSCQRTFEYGNAIHWANIALGRAALAHDDLTAAAEYLVRAGKTPGSPQLNSFGPDRSLARALLERGERTPVLTYLADCARFWAGNEALIEGWRVAIEGGEPTRLERSCDSDDT